MRALVSSVLSLRDLVEMMTERGLSLTTIMRWVQGYTPEFEKRRRKLQLVCRGVLTRHMSRSEASGVPLRSSRQSFLSQSDEKPAMRPADNHARRTATQ